MITKVDNYFLGQVVSDAPNLKEFTQEEYSNFEMAGAKIFLKDEKIYHGNDVSFAGSDEKIWNTVIGAIEGKIYKISIQHFTPDKNESDRLFKLILEYLDKVMGKCNEQTAFPKRYIWDRSEGNVIFDQVSNFGYCAINIFLTSSSIRQQVIDKKVKAEVSKQHEKNSSWVGSYIVAGLIWVASLGFRKTTADQYIVLIVSLGSGFLYHYLKPKIGFKNKFITTIIAFLILYFIAAILVGSLTAIADRLF